MKTKGNKMPWRVEHNCNSDIAKVIYTTDPMDYSKYVDALVEIRLELTERINYLKDALNAVEAEIKSNS